jgi:hypothetical protein
MLISPLKKKVRHPAAYMCYLCGTAMVGSNSLSKMVVHYMQDVLCSVINRIV